MACLATFVFFVAFVFVTWVGVWLDEWVLLELELVLAAPDTGNASTRTSTNPGITFFMPFPDAHPIHGLSLGGSSRSFAAF